MHIDSVDQEFRHNEYSLSMLHDVWGLSWETQRLKVQAAAIILGHIELHVWQLVLAVCRDSAELLVIKFCIWPVCTVFPCGRVWVSVQYGSWVSRVKTPREQSERACL